MFGDGHRPGRVYIIDDDPFVLVGLAVLLRNEGFEVGSYASAARFLTEVDQLEIGCVVMEARLPDVDGLQAQEALTRRRPDLPVILISRNGNIPLAVAALKHGAVDFLAKPFDPDALIISIRLALGSHRNLPEIQALREKLRQLTPREREVLDRLVAGETSKEIARSFRGSPRTVEVHRSRVLAKLGARNVADAVRIAASAGLESAQR
jgi:two-component system response regulator FixJ